MSIPHLSNLIAMARRGLSTLESQFIASAGEAIKWAEAELARLSAEAKNAAPVAPPAAPAAPAPTPAPAPAPAAPTPPAEPPKLAQE